MRILRIGLWNFRNYETLNMDLPQGITLITGRNAQGKTNLLESISLCSTGRSHRTRKDRDLIRWGSKSAQVLVEAQHRYAKHSVKMTMHTSSPREVEVNAAKISRIGEMMGHINSVLFAPEDLKLIKDGPQERRRFLDMAISQASPTYFYALQRYQRILQQRNVLLRQIAIGQSKPESLDLWDEQLAKQAEFIHESRWTYVQSISGTIAEIHQDIAGSQEKMDIRYRPSPDVQGDTYGQALIQALHSARGDELRQGITLSGPHRDELIPSIHGRDARFAASQGQQRTAALSMKLSQVLILQQQTEEWPVLLLDDVMSELDPYRRDALLHWIGEAQTLITAAQQNMSLPMKVREYTVQAGEVSAAEGD